MIGALQFDNMLALSVISIANTTITSIIVTAGRSWRYYCSNPDEDHNSLLPFHIPEVHSLGSNRAVPEFLKARFCLD